MRLTFGLSGLKLCLAGSLLLAGIAVHAQQPVSRIAAIDNSNRTTLAGSRDPRAALAVDRGELPASTPLHGMTLMFTRTPAQEQALETLLAAQQNPASTFYHQWLTPQQFGAAFGLSSPDLAAAQSWLESEGFTVDGVAQARNAITFSGTAAQVAHAFQTSLHTYTFHGETRFAPSSELTLPASLAGVVASVNNLTSFRPRSAARLRPAFTSSQTGNHFFSPKDIATAYGISTAYTAGYTGAGQQIAIIGESSVATADITNFQAAAGVPVRAPATVLVPNSGAAYVSEGDEAESDLDLEYSSSIATGASVYFVYTGNNANTDVSTALNYAIDTRIAPVISISYGYCEPLNSTSFFTAENAMLAQAAAQGQSVIAASGDTGSAGCSGYIGEQGVTTATATGLAVSWPASSQYATAVGGTEITPANATSASYWTTASAGQDVVSSVTQYIPEIAWNDGYQVVEGVAELGASSGGASVLFPRPSWQTGVTGIPAGTFRLVPDVSLYASPEYPGYLYCSSDPSSGVTGSCSVGFRDANNSSLTVAGGTSFGAPIFAGMVAIINQAKKSTGQGVLGSTLYPLAANATTYASAFHDILSGTNECPAASGICSTATETNFVTGTGYDEVTGLGSVNFYSLLTAWPAAASVISSLQQASITTLTAATPTPGASASDTITVAVAGANGAATAPTGTVTLTVDGVAGPLLTLSGGSATYPFSSATLGAHVISALYSGDVNFAASTGTVTLNLGPTIAMAATSITVAPGASGVSTVTVTPGNGYAGTVDFTVTTSSTALNNAACYSFPTTTSSLAVPGAPAQTQLTIYTSQSVCESIGLATTGPVALRRFAAGPKASLAAPAAPGPPPGAPGAVLALAGLTLAGLAGRRRLHLSRTTTALVLAALGLGLSLGLAGCTNGGANTKLATPVPVTVPAGSYTLTVVGTDSANPAISASANFTLTVN